MSDSTIALCLIVKNEEKHLQRCVDSFRGAVDEIIIVDTGSTDKTIQIAKSLTTNVFCSPWNNNFAEARQLSFDKASADWLIWADADDILRPGDAEKIRMVAQANKADIHYFQWKVKDHLLERERMVRKGSGRWERPIHEIFRPTLLKPILARIKAIQIIHDPLIEKDSTSRNIQMLETSIKDSALSMFYLAGEYQKNGKLTEARLLAQSILQLSTLGEIENYELNLILATTAGSYSKSIAHLMDAHALMPYRREALFYACEMSMLEGKNKEALAYARSMMGLKKPSETIWTQRGDFYSWKGIQLYAEALRLNCLLDEALQIEEIARKGNPILFSLLHATRGRPQKMFKARELWFSRADHPELIEHIFSVDEDDSEVLKLMGRFTSSINYAGGGCVTAWNSAAQIASGHIFIQLSDDWNPPRGWDSILLDKFGERINSEAVIRISDGIDRGQGEITDCICMAILTRERWQAQGFLFFPGFKSVYSDNDFTDAAELDGVIIDAKDVIFEHLHPINGKSQIDKTYQEQNAPQRYDIGKRLHLKRSDERRKLKLNYAALILATRDDFCLKEVCFRLHEEGVRNFIFNIPDEYWSGEPVKESEAQQVRDIAEQLKRLPLDNLRILNKPVGPHRQEDRLIIHTEGSYRNEILQYMKNSLCEHILIVDGDELWKRGTLQMLDNYIWDNSPEALYCKMIPVAGLPGYPIEGAKDVALVYLSAAGKFSACRSARGDHPVYPRRQVIHFTATRRTMQEIIDKHRASGHYDDPQYEFENWIENILPNIKPGMKRAHMFKGWDTWPEVRSFTAEEWQDIPESLHQYLGK